MRLIFNIDSSSVTLFKGEEKLSQREFLTKSAVLSTGERIIQWTTLPTPWINWSMQHICSLYQSRVKEPLIFNKIRPTSSE